MGSLVSNDERGLKQKTGGGLTQATGGSLVSNDERGLKQPFNSEQHQAAVAVRSLAMTSVD